MKDRTEFFVPILLGLFFWQVFFSLGVKSPTCDEFAHHTASGFSHLVTGDFRMNPAEPPLSRLLSAIPLYFLGVKAPLEDDSWAKGDSPAFAQKFFYQPGFSQDRIIFWARLPILLLALFFGYFVFVWARELFGYIGGVTALVLFTFCPDILAHSGLATSDIAVALFFYLTLWRFWKYLKKQSRKNLVLTGVMAGLAFLSKFSAILIFPTLLLIVPLSGSRKKISLGRTAGFLAVCFLTVWAGYFFEMKPLLKNTPDPPKKIAVYRAIGGESLVRFANEVPVPLSTFVSAFGSMMMTRARGTNAFLMGEWSHSQKSWWYYYFVAFGIKNTLPFLILILLSFCCLSGIPADRLTKTFLIVPIALFFLMTMRDKAQAGIRYFLPIYPLFFLLCGGWAAWAWRQKKVFKFLLAGLLSWHALEAARIFPYHLAYFNELIGGPDQGYRYLRDSNIDWGQDLKGVAEWAKEQGSPEVVLETISPVDLRKAYGVPWRTLTEPELREPGPHVYAFGVHLIDGIDWVHRYRPVRIIGHSMWVYDFRKTF
jgi:hypothetical protein